MPLVRVLRPCVCVCASLLLFFALIVFLLVLLLLLLLFLVCVCVFFFVSCFLTVSRGVSFGWWPRFSQDMKRCTAPGVDQAWVGVCDWFGVAVVTCEADKILHLI